MTQGKNNTDPVPQRRPEPRFDVLWKENGPSLDYHFCRSWDIDANGNESGCYGTNPDHGYSFDEAKEEIAKWHESQVDRWRKMTLTEWGHVDPAVVEERTDD